MAVTAHILYPDLGFGGTLSLTAGSTATGYALTAMQDGNASSTWKSATLTGANTIKIDLGSSQTVAALAIIGHNLYSARNAGATYTGIAVTYSTDDVSYTTAADSSLMTCDRITSDLPYIAYVGATARYLKVQLTDPVGARAYAPEIADLFVAGYALDTGEPTGLPWTPHDLKIVSRTTGSDLGMGIPSVPAHVASKVKVEIGQQAIDHDFFDDLVPSADYPKADAGPSFAHWVRTCYTLGARFVYAPFHDSHDPVWLWYHDVTSGAFQVGDVVTGGTSGISATVVALGELYSGNNQILAVTGWNWTAGIIDEIVTGSVSTATSLFIAIGPIAGTAHLPTIPGGTGGNQRHWIGAQIVRAGDGTAKLRTPFVNSWRRKLSMDMAGTMEWGRR